MPKLNFCRKAILPTKETAKRYGMTVEEWSLLLDSQGGVCAICRRVPPSGRFVVDHQHVPKWKKMQPAERRKYVRGILCFLCNGKCADRHMTTVKALRTYYYFKSYDERREIETRTRQQSDSVPRSPKKAPRKAGKIEK